MGKYVTPRGVVVEADDAAALNVGYKPVNDSVKPAAAKQPADKPAKSAPKKASSGESKK